MPEEIIENKARRHNGRPNMVDLKISWPDEDAGDGDYVLEYLDRDQSANNANANNANWQEIGVYNTKSTAQKAADAYLGHEISDVDWK